MSGLQDVHLRGCVQPPWTPVQGTFFDGLADLGFRDLGFRGLGFRV